MKSLIASISLSVCALGAHPTFAQMPNGPEPGAIVWTESTSASAPTARKSIDLQRVILRIPQGQPIGTLGVGLACLGGTRPIWINRTGDANPADFRPGFAQELAAAGYPAPGGGGESLFDNVEEAPAELALAGAITSLKLKYCEDPLVGSFSGTGNITVEWQVLDPLERKIVYRGTTTGQAKARSEYETVSNVGMRAAFSDAARVLLNSPDFIQATSRSQATGTDSLGAQSLSASDGPTLIAYLPLSTRPFTQQVKEIEAQVVTVRSGMSHGSGFYIADGLLLTNHHVAGKGTPVKVRFPSGREASGMAIASNARRDVALIKTEPVGITGLPLHLEEPAVGSQVYVIGSPLETTYDNTLSSGIVSAVREMEGKRYIQSDVMVQPGNSGGPMFDDKGNIIGITVSGASNAGVSVGINFFIPIAEALVAVNVTRDATSANQTIVLKEKGRTKTP